MKFYFKLFAILIITNAFPVVVVEQASNDRLNEVEHLGQHVMPFDLNQTLLLLS